MDQENNKFDIPEHNSPIFRMRDGSMSRIGRLGGRWDDPLQWAVPIGTYWGVSWKIHLLFLFYGLVQLARSFVPIKGHVAQADTVFILIGISALFFVAFIHELARALVCRIIGGDVVQIIMWPLGGINTHYNPKQWLGQLISNVSGPCANLLVCIILTPYLIFLVGNWEYVIFNPLTPWSVYAQWSISSPTLIMKWLWWINYTSMAMLIINILPMYPLDGSYILHALLWQKLRYRRALEISTITGYLISTLLTIIGLITEAPLIVCFALIGWFLCWQQRRSLAFIEGQEDVFDDDAINNLPTEYPDESINTALPNSPDNSNNDHSIINYPENELSHDSIPYEYQRSDQILKESEEIELDRILKQISESGLKSLTTAEQDLLKRATNRRKHG